MHLSNAWEERENHNPTRSTFTIFPLMVIMLVRTQERPDAVMKSFHLAVYECMEYSPHHLFVIIVLSLSLLLLYGIPRLGCEGDALSPRLPLSLSLPLPLLSLQMCPRGQLIPAPDADCPIQSLGVPDEALNQNEFSFLFAALEREREEATRTLMRTEMQRGTERRFMKRKNSVGKLPDGWGDRGIGGDKMSGVLIHISRLGEGEGGDARKPAYVSFIVCPIKAQSVSTKSCRG